MEPYEAREIAAKAWCDNSTSHLDMIHELAEAFAKILVEEVGRASPASVPEAWKIVPVEPTQEMLNAMFETRKIAPDDADLIVQYNALLAAAPTPPVSEDRKDAERYRALKTGDFAVDQFVSASYGWKVIPTKELDQAIDAAMYGEVK